MVREGTRECANCRKNKSISHYYIARRERNGYGTYCKTCANILYPTKQSLYAKQYAKAHRENLKQLVFQHYGYTCAYCGSSDNIQVDHMSGDGKQHRKTVKDLYRWLVKNNFPDGYQTLCRIHNIMKSNLSDHDFRKHIDITYAYLHKV